MQVACVEHVLEWTVTTGLYNNTYAMRQVWIHGYAWKAGRSPWLNVTLSIRKNVS